MPEALHEARKSVLDSGGIPVSLRISPCNFSNHCVWFEMIHPDDYPIPLAEQWTNTLYTDVDKHHIQFGDYDPGVSRNITNWIRERTRHHLSSIVSKTECSLRPVGLVDSRLGEGFLVAIERIERIGLHVVVPGCSTAMQWIHWKHFFRQNDPRVSETEKHFATWRQESKKET